MFCVRPSFLERGVLQLTGLYFILYKKELKNELNEAEFFSSNTTKL
jgi:hypothetical protein